MRPLVLVLQGANMDRLGVREPHIYGTTSLQEVHETMRQRADMLGLNIAFYQSNELGDLVDFVRRHVGAAFAIANPAGFTADGYSLRDALEEVSIPFIEVHVSNIFAREAIHHKSAFTDAATGTIIGFGVAGYLLALEGIAASRIDWR